ncbi:hypothetical protein N7488_004751 [Penicillium malachiteum]|nr:hypothetical protein N7488_004751 [Penicillium malachiteum]
MSFGWSVDDLVNAVSILVQVAEAAKDVQGALEAYSLDGLFFKSVAVTLEALTQSLDKMNGLEEHIDEIYRAVEQFREWFEKRVGVALSPITTSNSTTTKS